MFKTKVFFRILAAIFAINFFCVNQSVSAMVGVYFDFDTPLPVAVDPSVNAINSRGLTPLIEAIYWGNAALVKDLLRSGADVYLWPQGVSDICANVLEYAFCISVILYSGPDKKVVTKALSPEDIEKYCEVVDAIIEHCILYKLPMDVNIGRIRKIDRNAGIVWDCYDHEYFYELKQKYPHLFTVSVDVADLPR